jgi:hypothetical protein
MVELDVDADIQKYRRDYGRDTEEEEVVADADDAADGQCWKEARKAMGGNSLATEEGVRDIQHLARNVAGRFLSLLPVAVTPRSLETFLTLSATNSSSMKRSNFLIQREGLVNSYESAPSNAEDVVGGPRPSWSLHFFLRSLSLCALAPLIEVDLERQVLSWSC